MRFQAASPRGYCYGVINAINTAINTRNRYPLEKIYILGMIVHNKYIVKSLDNLNIITLDDTNTSRLELIDQIDEGIVILSAHGSDAKIKDKAKMKNLKIIDATCKDVLKTQDLIKEKLNDGYEIIYYGKKNHPESHAALSINQDKIHLVCDINDLDKLDYLKDKKILITNQTTLSFKDAFNLFEIAKTKFNNIEISPEICSATRTRQEAIYDLDDDVDILYIVGDPKSNNSNKLRQIGIDANIKDVYLIESVDDINIEDLKDKKYVGISSGASTPTYLTTMVISYLEAFEYNNKDTHQKPEIEINKILT